jgi:DNA-binding transcriptional ArsR family regulator
MAPKSKSKAKQGMNQGLVKALTHPLRVEILMILNERTASPNELSKELNEGLGQVSYHVKVLRDYNCIELVDTAPRRGAVEHYYRATSRAFLTDDDWRAMPESVKPGLSADLLQVIVDDAVAALEGGTFHRRDEHHQSWTPMLVDEQGWKDATDTLREALDRVLEIQAESAARLAKSSEQSIPISVTMLGYEVPPTSPQAPLKKKAEAARQANKDAEGAKS